MVLVGGHHNRIEPGLSTRWGGAGCRV